MKKTLQLLKTPFESSSGLTPQFQAFARTFKREFKALVEGLGGEKVEISRGHFYLSGFFTFKGQMWYLGMSDVRFSRGDGTLYIRTVKSYQDFTGGRNISLSWDSLEHQLKRILEG